MSLTAEPENPDKPKVRNWAAEALKYAEAVGLCEYEVNGRLMEYWTFYSEGWYFVRYDLELQKEVFRGAHIPWTHDYPMYNRVPAFLRTETGSLKYNYMLG